MLGEVELVEVLVHGVAQVVLDVEGHPATSVAAQVGGAEGHDAEADEQCQPRGERRTVMEDDVVDDLALDEGYHGLGGRCPRARRRGRSRGCGCGPGGRATGAVPSRAGAPETRPKPGRPSGSRLVPCRSPLGEVAVDRFSDRDESLHRRSRVPGGPHQLRKARGHRGLGTGEHHAPLVGQAEADRPLVAGHVVVGQKTLRDECSDSGTHRGFAESEALSEPGRPLVAGGDEGEEAVVGQTEFRRGLVEHPRESCGSQQRRLGARRLGALVR